MALKAHTTFVSPLYQTDKIIEYRTSIMLRHDGLSYAMIDTKLQQLMKMQDFVVQKTVEQDTANKNNIDILQYIRELLEDIAPELGISAHLSIVIDSPMFTIVPDFLIRDDKDAQQHLSFAYKLPISYRLWHYHLFGSDKQLITALPQKSLAYITKQKNTKLHHVMGVLYQGVQQNLSYTQKTKSAIAYVSTHTLFLSVYEGSKLWLSNSYTFHTKEDFIYYILLAYKQLEMNPNEDKLYLLGQVSRQSQLFDICWQYIRHVEFFPPNNQQLLSNMPKAAHQHYILTQAALCE
ncbi:MAG: hypothetical protein CSB02_00800 [Bacteroidia bacterium]|nr:MAG: hypothetical protein CSB02_00800 [Bacteroidia bacterium]